MPALNETTPEHVQALLARAADTIRQERVRSSSLAAENERLNEEISRLLQVIKEVHIDNAVLVREFRSTKAQLATQQIERTETPAKVELNVRSAKPSERTQRQTSPAIAEETGYSEGMIERLRRAVAPPPTPDQMAALVDAMVCAVHPELDKRGYGVDFVKVGKCLYRIGRRRLNLTVDSGRLVVKSGGGHTDLLEYIERYVV